MNEPFFGSGSPIWTGIPSAGPWFQPPVPVGSPIASPGTAAPPFVTPIITPQAFRTAVTPDVLSYTGFGAPGFVPALGGPEVPSGPSARALLTAVALRRGQPMGPTSDQEIEEFLYDAFDLLGASEVEVRCDAARATLTGSVGHKRLKRDVGEVVWAMPGIADVQNNVTIAGRRRSRGTVREAESQAASQQARKSA